MRQTVLRTHRTPQSSRSDQNQRYDVGVRCW